MSTYNHLVAEQINIRELVKQSESALLKQLPGWAYVLLEKIVYQDEINRIINKYSEFEGVDFLSKMVDEFKIEPVVSGIENLPAHGKCFFVANHPYGIADGLLLTCIISSRYGNLKAIGNDVFMLIPQLRPLIAAVNVFGSNYRDYIRELTGVYKSEIPVTHFPAGRVSRVIKFRVEDGIWQKSFISKAVECKRDIVPIYFPGKNSSLFYFIYLLRKMFFIKTNLELTLLPRELFNKKNRKIRVVIRKPIPYNTFDNSRSHSEWAQWVKTRVYRDE